MIRNKNVWILILSSGISDIANWIYRIAVLNYAVTVYNTAFSSSVVSLLMILPSVLFGFYAGKLADSKNKKHIMLVCDAIRILMVIALGITMDIGILFILLISSAAVFADVCEDSILPELASKDELPKINSIYSFLSSGLMIVGPVIGGLVSTYLSVSNTIILIVCLLVCAGIIRSLLKYHCKQHDKMADKEHNTRTLVDVFRVVRRNRVLNSVLSTVGIVSLASGMLNALLIIFVYQILGKNSSDYGILLSAKGIAMTIASFLLIGIIRKLNNEKAYTISLTVMGLCTFFFSLCHVWVLSIAIQCILAISNIVYSVARKTLIQQNCEQIIMGRYFGLMVLVSNFASVISLIIFGSISDYIGVVASFQIGGVLTIVSGILAYAILCRVHRNNGIDAT